MSYPIFEVERSVGRGEDPTVNQIIEALRGFGDPLIAISLAVLVARIEELEAQLQGSEVAA